MSDCIIYKGKLNASGYGEVYLRGRWPMRAHRVSYILHNGGKAIKKGMHIAHKCNVRACYNPEHLEEITPKENMAYKKVNIESGGGNFNEYDLS